MFVRQLFVIATAACFALVPQVATQPLAASQSSPVIASELAAGLGRGLETQEIFALTSGQEGFGGLWVDEEGLIHLAVQFGYLEAIEGSLGDKFTGLYVVDLVPQSYEELIERRDAVSKELTPLTSQDLVLMEWGPDVQHNTLWISLVDYTEGKAALAREILGQDVIVKPSLTSGGVGDLFIRKSTSNFQLQCCIIHSQETNCCSAGSSVKCVEFPTTTLQRPLRDGKLSRRLPHVNKFTV